MLLYKHKVSREPSFIYLCSLTMDDVGRNEKIRISKVPVNAVLLRGLGCEEYSSKQA